MNQELFQIVIQYLKRNYPEICNQSPIVNDNLNTLSEQQFKDKVINGMWDEIDDNLSDYDSNEIVKTTLFKLIEQRIQETLEKGDQTGALELLRSRLTPLKLFPDRIHQLAQDILLMKAAPRYRSILAQEICGELRKVDGLILPENRLEELIQQACAYQRINCPFHLKDDENVSNLWTDHKCLRSEPLKLKAVDVECKCVARISNKEILNVFMSKSGRNVFVVDDDSKVISYSIDNSNTVNTTQSKSFVTCESATFWPKITDKLPELIGSQLLISPVMTEEEQLNYKTLFSGGNLLSIAITADANLVICSNEDQNTTIFDAKDGKVIHSWIRLRCSHLLTSQNPADKYFLAVSDNGSILQISTESFDVMRTLPSMNERLHVSSAYLDEKRLLIGYNNSTLYYYEDWQSYEHPTRIFRGHICTQFRVNSILSRYDTNLALSCSENGSIYGWNIATGRLIYEIVLHERCSNDILEIGPGRFVTCGDDGKLCQWKLK